jgi:hypothetical protein
VEASRNTARRACSTISQLVSSGCVKITQPAGPPRDSGRMRMIESELEIGRARRLTARHSPFLVVLVRGL